MKVKELIEQLSKLDGELLVVMASDAEGNHMSLLDGVTDDDTVFVEEEGEIYDNDDDYVLEAEDIEAAPCVVLWPVS